MAHPSNHPKRLHHQNAGRNKYQAMRRRIWLYNFSSQYQQRPIPIRGNLVKREWLRFDDIDGAARKYLRVVQSWDTAAKTSELNDYSVCTTWGPMVVDRACPTSSACSMAH
jgi:hypothetical protein